MTTSRWRLLNLACMGVVLAYAAAVGGRSDNLLDLSPETVELVPAGTWRGAVVLATILAFVTALIVLKRLGRPTPEPAA